MFAIAKQSNAVYTKFNAWISVFLFAWNGKLYQVLFISESRNSTDSTISISGADIWLTWLRDSNNVFNLHYLNAHGASTGFLNWSMNLLIHHLRQLPFYNYNDVIMDTMASQITCLTIVYSTVYSGKDQRKHQSSASLAFVWGIHRGPVDSP